MRRHLLLIPALALVAGTACQKDVTRPAGDDSPPGVTLSVVGLPTNPPVGPDGADVLVHTGETATLVASTIDPQGARSIRLEGGYSAYCQAGDVGQVKQGTFRESKVQPDGTATVPTAQALQLNLDRAYFAKSCGPARLVRFEGQVRATGDNFGGKVVSSGWLRFRHQPGPRALNVMTYNIHGTANASKGIPEFAPRLDGFAEALRAADVALLQEVRTQPVDQARAIAERIGMPYVAYGKNKNGSFADVAIISRHPLKDVQSHHPETPSCTFYCTKHEAVVLEATVTVAGLDVRVTNLHLVPDGEGTDRTEYRTRAMDLVVRRLRATAGPVIVGGDVNAQPGTPPMQRLSTELKDAFLDVPGAFDDSPRIDVLFYRTPLRPLSYTMTTSDPPVTPITLSDHPKITVSFGVS